MAGPSRICNRCIMDSNNDPDIIFDSSGYCNNCTLAIKRLASLPPPEEKPAAFERIIEALRREGSGNEYDCVVGISGGVDSTYILYLVKTAGLRPLAVHFDNGWNSELAVDNIKSALDILDVELVTHVVNWEEFKDLQLSFLKASVKNTEVPTDHAITAVTMKTAAKFGVRSVVTGNNLATESILPESYGYLHEDLRNLKAIHKRFGALELRTFPTFSLYERLDFTYLKGIKKIPLLNYVNYDKAAAKLLLAEKLGWRDYGGKHYESVWTRFHQGHYLVAKFGLDKRRAHLSSLIASGQMTRDQALRDIDTPPYSEDLLKQDIEFVMKKFGFSRTEYDAIMSAPQVDARVFPNHYKTFRYLLRLRGAVHAFGRPRVW